MTLAVREITLDTLPPFVLRAADEMECRAGGMEGTMAVRRSVAGSDRAFAHYAEGELLCLWGYRVENWLSGAVMMWLLTTPEVDNHRLRFARESKALLVALLREFSTVQCFVHNDHLVAVRWLEWLGFRRVKTLTPSFTIMQKDRARWDS